MSVFVFFSLMLAVLAFEIAFILFHLSKIYGRLNRMEGEWHRLWRKTDDDWSGLWKTIEKKISPRLNALEDKAND